MFELYLCSLRLDKGQCISLFDSEKETTVLFCRLWTTDEVAVRLSSGFSD